MCALSSRAFLVARLSLPFKDGSFDMQLPLGRYELSVDGCKMPGGQPYDFVETGSRYLHWTIDPEGVCVLGPEAPAGIYGGQ